MTEHRCFICNLPSDTGDHTDCERRARLDERAAILEYDAGLWRDEAEMIAADILRRSAWE